MFATFIDNKIISQWQDPEVGVRVFDMRNKVKATSEDHQRAVYDRAANLAETGMRMV